MENKQIQNETALERYKIISPILSGIAERADRAKISLLKSEALQEAGISRNTLACWLAGLLACLLAGLNVTPKKVSTD